MRENVVWLYGQRDRFASTSLGNHTEHVAWPAIFAKELLVLFERPPKPDEKLCSALKASHLIPGLRLQALGELLHGQLLQALLVYLVLVVPVAGEQSLQWLLARGTDGPAGGTGERG